MKRRQRYLSILVIVAAISILAGTQIAGQNGSIDTSGINESVQVNRLPHIEPDYAGTVIPPNIAPLNFVVTEPGTGYCVRLKGKSGESIEVSSREGRMIFPEKPWRQLLGAHKGTDLTFDIHVKDQQGTWQRFETMTVTVAAEEIDPYLAYRSIGPLYNWYENVGIYQRDLSSFECSAILHGESYGGGCVNCHTFHNYKTDRMFIGVRDNVYESATLLIDGKHVSKIGTRFGYTSWHPSGKLAVYSINKVRLFFHDTEPEVRDVVDLDSALNIYDVRTQTVKSHPSIAQKDRLETYPTWSPDGKYLYFCSAPILWEDRDTVPPKNYEKVRYDLCRVSYDLEEDAWGQPETILSAEAVGKSILLPRISPDGRFLVFCLCDYGCFPVYRADSDLYCIDLQEASSNGQYTYHPLTQANSDHSESWHSFSSNSRWLVFSSKRDNDVFTRPWFCYIDSTGKAHKPFVLPQKDPTFYETHLKTFNTPEFITEPVKISQRQLARAVRSSQQIQAKLPLTGASPKAPTSPTTYHGPE